MHKVYSVSTMHTPTARSAKLLARSFQTSKRALLSVLLLSAMVAFAPSSAHPDGAPDAQGLAPILTYISTGWDTLTRSMNECKSVGDTKLAATSVMYLPADYPEPAALKELQKQCKFEVRPLPVVIHHPGEVDANNLNPPGLLYLENKYVVPGGRFNEMYGWDSYFILRGLVRDGRIDLARGIVENFFFEIEHYGNVLNANRSYYLSRSQPPFLTSMILSVYDAEKSAGHENNKWLERAYAFAVKDHDMWTVAPHLAGDTGLSRYFDRGDGPSPESVKDETGHYREVAGFFLRHPDQDDHYLVRKDPGKTDPPTFGAQYAVRVCDTGHDASPAIAQPDNMPGCNTAEDVALSADFYKGDRSMRESGYDISFRFGPYGAGTQNYAPVCLNSLLYKTEKDLQQISATLGHEDEARKWGQLAEQRQANMNKYLWDAPHGMFFDYNFVKQQLSTYPYVTVFFPLWAGWASPEQANAVVVKHLSTFEQPGGLVMSPHESGGQWDFPYAWAPNQLVAIEGLRRYNFNEDADRLSYKFLSTVAENFRRDGTIREKYNAVTRSDETNVTAGYHVNLIGFGWTNGVFLSLLHELPKPLVERLAQEQSTNAPAPAKATD
jgi:alpha,alpha-trehalase